MTDTTNDNLADAGSLVQFGTGDGMRRIDLAFIRSGDEVELLVLGAPDDVVVRHAYWDYDAQKIGAMYNRTTSPAEQETFVAKAIQAVQAWDSDGGMRRLKDQRRIRELEDQVARLSGRKR